MDTVLLVIQLISAIFLVVVILLQRSEGGALSGLGGAGSSSNLFTARGTGNLLTRLTAILAVAFMASSLLLSIVHSNGSFVGKKSILETPAATSSQPVKSAEPVAPVAGE
jgi:preprotein translocase subunit SecG